MNYKTLASLIFIISLMACESKDDNDSYPSGGTGTINILSVTPDTGLSNGVTTDFQVNVEYELSNADLGELWIGFNTDSINSFRLITGADTIINQGSGQHMFYVSVIPKNWNPNGDFKVFVILSQYPHDKNWMTIDSDIRSLLFQ